MRFVSQIAALATLWAATVAADADADASEFGEMGKSLRNRGIFDRLMKRQTTQCPVGTYCTDGNTCCGYYCCYTGASCNGQTNDFLKSCVSDDGSSFNSTSTYDTYYDDIINSITASLSDIYAAATPTSVEGIYGGGTVPSATATPSSTDGTSSEPTTSGSFTSSGNSTTETKSGFSSWSTGSKVGLILGSIVGVAILAGLIWWVSVMTCCKRKHKVQHVSNLHPPMASVPQPPPGPPTMPPTPAPPYAHTPHPVAPELDGGQDHYAYKPDAYGNYQEPPVAPKFDPQTGSYQSMNNGPVFEAPENTVDSRR